jgi:flagellar hook-associated protein 3 FlgL
MPFRVTNTTLFNTAIENIRRNQELLGKLQQQAGSGKRLNAVSDDPADAAQLLGLRRTMDRLEQFQSNISAGRANLEATEGALAEISNHLIRLRELAVSADTELEQFDMMLPEVEGIFNEIVRLGNSRSGSGYVFGGYRTMSAPFDASGDFVGVPPGNPLPSALLGEIDLQIGESATVTTNLLGASVFKGDSDGDGSPDAGQVDIFQVVGDFRDALANQDPDGIFAAIGEIDQALDQVLNSRGIAGARLNRLEVAERQLESLDTTLQLERSAIEDVDFVETITKLTNVENTYQASLAITARILQTDLADFLT